MTDRIALQLYTVRELAQKDYEATVRKVAEAGYHAVETAGFPGSTPEAAAKLFRSLGLTVSSAHVGLPVGEQAQQILESVHTLGDPTLVCTQIGPDDVKTMDSIQALCERLNQGYAATKAAGLRFAIHNHWWEFAPMDGRLVHDVMEDLLDPGVLFELDTYWIKVAGVDPAAVVRRLGSRAPLLHIKDGPANREDAQTAVGDGVVDVPAIVAAGGKNAEWLVIELDRCDTDILEAIRKSRVYLGKIA